MHVLWASPGRAISLLVEGLLGDAEGVDCRRHPAVEDHLRDNFRDFLLGHADVQSAGDVPLDHLRAVAQHNQSGDGAEAAGLQVHGGPVIYLAVDYRIHQPHHIRGQLRHRRRWLRVVVGPVVTHTELGRSVIEVRHKVFLPPVLKVVFLIFEVGLIGTQVRIFAIEVGGQDILQPGQSGGLTKSASSGGLPS